MQNDDGTVIIILNPPTHAVVADTIKTGPSVQIPDGWTRSEAAHLLRKAAQALEIAP
jgi:hypothetical protein